MSLIGKNARCKSKTSKNQEYRQCGDILPTKENFSRCCQAIQISPYLPMPLAEMSADAGAGDRQLRIDERESCFVIPCGSLTNHTGGEENSTPNCRQQGLPNPVGMDKKSCSTSQHCHCIVNPPASYTRRAWGQVSRAMLWKKQGTTANSFCPFSSFYISFSTISSFAASPLPPSPPPAPRHPVKHVIVQDVWRSWEQY